MKMETAKLVKHAYELAAAFDIDLVLMEDLPPDTAVAMFHPDGKQRGVMAKVITDETSYAVVLHEMGHHLAPCGFLRKGMKEPAPGCHPRERHRWINLKLMEEEAAWAWARHYALEWTTAMQMVELQAYGTYTQVKASTR
jgi:hypothetical protein